MFHVDFRKAIEFASKDPAIKDLASFEKYLSFNAKDTNFSDVRPEDAGVKKFSSKQFSVGDNGDIRGATSRPGFGSDLSNTRERLRNRPDEFDKDYEVYNTDKIPLSTYRKMSIDPMIRLGTNLLVGLISGLKYSITHPDPKIEAVVDNLYKPHHNTAVRNMLTAGLRNGFAFGEKVWMRDNVRVSKSVAGENKVVYSGKVAALKKVKWLDPEQNFEFYKDKTDEVSRVKQYQSGGIVEVKRSKLAWFILDREFSSIFGKSRYKSGYSDWYYSKMAFQYMLKHLEKSGSPHLEVRYPLGVNELDGVMVENDQIAQRMAYSLLSHGSVIMPSTIDEKGNYTWSLEYKEPNNTSLNAYKEFIEMSDRRKLQAEGIPDAILVGDSNFSEADAKIDLLMVMVEDLVDQVQETLKCDIVDQLATYNFGPQALHDLEFRVERSGLGQKKILKEIMINMLRIGSSIDGRHLAMVPDLERGLKDLNVPVTTFDKALMESEEILPEGQTPLDKSKRQDQQNDPSQSRVNKTERDRERDSKAGNATNS